ncbi:hypothetical protein MKEN_01252900 [Mycena kentingensis (nom. inval.)]|nr:hypothetical protein MKEN_01252900 [Mycena kentingensis (nom. inval.)]
MDLRAILAAEPPSTEAEVFPPYTPRPAPDESSSSSGYFGSDVDAASPASSHSHAAHLATDDKNVLARLAERASAPEMRVSAAMTTAAAPLPAAAAAARAPAEDELDYEYHEFEGFEWDARDEAETEARDTNTDADRDQDRPPRLPSPPPADVTSSGAALEKMQLERAYAAQDGAGPSTPPALTFPSPSAPPAFSGEYEYEYSEMVASAPTLDDDGDGDLYPQAGPSTPRQVASAPPMSEEDEDEEQLEYADEEDDQLGEEVGEVFVDREEERRRRSLGKQPERGEAASSREDSPETEARRRESGQRPRPRPRSQVSDTGWDDGGGG